MVHVTHCKKINPPSPSNVQSPPTGVTTTENDTSCNNLTKQVSHVPNDSDSDQSSSDSSSSDSSDPIYCKISQHTRKRIRGNMRNNEPNKKCAELTAKLHKVA